MPAERVPEAFVWWLWETRRAGSLLTTLDGRKLRVIYPGRRWGSWGPDFREALLALDDHVLRGAVEVHVRAHDWVTHGHSSDPEYRGTILHVIFRASEGDQGPDLPTVAIAQHLTEPIGLLLIEWQAAPRVNPTMACQTPAEAVTMLDRAGLARLAGKAARFEGDFSAQPPIDSLLTAALEALGYARNVEPMRQLSDRFPPASAVTWLRIAPIEARARLFGMAGLLPSQRGRLPLDDYALMLEKYWRDSGEASSVAPLHWHWIGVRPANTPVRRVATAAALLEMAGAFLEPDLLAALMELPPRSACTALRHRLTLATDPYWTMHSDFGRPLQRTTALLGDERAADIVVNVVLPWALALSRRREIPGLEAATLSAYRQHPRLADNQITRHMSRQVLGDADPRLVDSACRQQGLIELYQGWCDFRACASCPAGPLAPGTMLKSASFTGGQGG
ncbi:MAG: DUF2851 family protein [Chloroflexi bacterium]|nr:DUF2851 family protein [Chloroflexota bacterium]